MPVQNKLVCAVVQALFLELVVLFLLLKLLFGHRVLFVNHVLLEFHYDFVLGFLCGVIDEGGAFKGVGFSQFVHVNCSDFSEVGELLFKRLLGSGQANVAHEY